MSFAITAVALAVVSAGVSAYGASEQANAAKVTAQNNQMALDYQALVDKNNAKIEEYKRADAINRGEEAAQDAMRQRADLIGRQRAALAASGVDATQGSAVDVLATTEFYGQQDVNRIQANAAREAWGYDITKKDATESSKLASWQAQTYGNQAGAISPGKQAALAGGGSLLSSAGSYALSMRKAG